MKHVLSTFLCVFIFSGCTHYAYIEQVQIGITIEELMQIDTPCYVNSTYEDKTLYNCRFRVSSKEYTFGRSVKPYILTFEDDTLTDITLNEHELDRLLMREWYYGPGYHPYGYPYPYYRFERY